MTLQISRGTHSKAWSTAVIEDLKILPLKQPYLLHPTIDWPYRTCPEPQLTEPSCGRMSVGWLGDLHVRLSACLHIWFTARTRFEHGWEPGALCFLTDQLYLPRWIKLIQRYAYFKSRDSTAARSMWWDRAQWDVQWRGPDPLGNAGLECQSAWVSTILKGLNKSPTA